jgi:hypothetical protein
MGIGYKRNLYPLTAMGTNDKQNQRGQVQVWDSSTLQVPSLFVMSNLPCLAAYETENS